MDKDKVIDAVEKTGFPLEHRTAMAFIDSGWHVVSNKYYVDDRSDEVREIDLIAYKVGKVGDLRVYSAVVVSCKKSIDNTWVFMTRKIDPEDRNKDLTPLHFWTNDKALDYCLTREGFGKCFADRLAPKSEGIWSVPEREIFGFQELQPVKDPGKNDELKSYKTVNDKAIFSSITTLMKAQAYELGRLPDRKKEPSVYIFSLLAVMDGGMCEVSYDTNPPEVKGTQLQNYIAHYIIKGKEQYCRINFTHKDGLRKLIKEYDAAHASSKREIKNAIDGFYKSVFDNYRTKNVLRDLFVSKILFYVNILGGFKGDHKLVDGDIDISLDKKTNILAVQISTGLSDEFVANLNSIEQLVAHTKKHLKAVYRYDGDFVFEPGFPF